MTNLLTALRNSGGLTINVCEFRTSSKQLSCNIPVFMCIRPLEVF